MNLPLQFIDKAKQLFGGEWDTFVEALTQEPPVSIRINEAKVEQLENLDAVKWNPSGYYLPSRPYFTFDPLFHAGCYYPQEASSMFVGEVIRQCIDQDIRMLDLCAAPGGKSTHMLSALSKNSLLISNEVIRSRANILSENITKWGYPNAIVTNNDPAEIGKLTHYFDAILVDAPCSGEGMFRKDETALSEWSEANVRLCKERQQRILADVWNALKPDGLLIYSTCTYNTEENEDNVQWICDNLGAEPIRLDIPEDWHITGALKGDLPVYRFLPHKTKGEGFFLAVLRKNDEENISQKRYKQESKEKNKKGNTPKVTLADEYKRYLKNPKEYHFFQKGYEWCGIPSIFEQDYNYIASQLKIVSAGVNLGEMKGKDFIPDQSLALSSEFDTNRFPVYDIDWKTAISYLQKNAITLDNSCPKGYILLTFGGKPLGFVKNIGNRSNNLYPQEWRIRTSIIPDNYYSFI